MQKGKRKRADQTQTKNDTTCQKRCRSTKQKKSSETTELNNNYMNETEDTTLPSSIEIDSSSKTMEPMTKVICKRTDRESNDLTPNTTETDDYLASNTSDTSVSNLLHEIGSVIEKLSRKKNTKRKPRSTPQKKLVKSEPMEMNNNPSCVTDTPSAGQVQTDSIPKMSQPKVKCTRKLRGKSLKKLVKSKEIVMDDDPISETNNTTSDSWLEIVSMPEEVPKEKLTFKPEGRTRKKVMKSEPLPINDSPECENKDVLSATEIQIDSTSETLKPKATLKRRGKSAKKVIKSTKEKPKRKRLCKPKNTQQNILVKSEPMEINNNPDCEIEDILVVTHDQTQTDLISETSRPETKCIYKVRGRWPEKEINSAPMEMNITPGCENKDISLETEVQTHLVSKTTKPKAKRGRKPKAKEPEIVIESDAMKTCYLANETKSTALDSGSTSKLGSMMTKAENKSVTRSTARRPRKIKASEEIEMDNNLAGETECIPPKSCSQADSVSEILVIRDKPTYNSEEKSQAIEPKTNSIDDHTEKNKNLPLENHNLCDSMPETVENKYRLLDKIYQPKVLLCNIAYSDKLSPKQRKMLSKNIQSKNCLGQKIMPDSTTGQSTERSTSHDIIIASPELGKKNDEPILQGVSSIKACENEHSNPRKQRVWKKGERITRSKVLTLKNWDAMYTSELSVRDPETNSSSANETDVLSSVGNEAFKFSIQPECSPSTGLSLEEGSLPYQNDFEKKVTELIVPPDEQILMWPLPQIMELEVPLDLSVRNSEKSISDQLEFSKFNNHSTREICSETNKDHVYNIGFGSSTFNLRDLSTSFTEINDDVDSLVSENISKLGEKINICRKSTSQSSKHLYNNLMLCAPPESAEEILPITSTASKGQTKQASVKPEKLPFKNTLSIKVSLSAEHFNEQFTTHKKLDTVVDKEEVFRKNAQNESHIKLNETDLCVSENIIHPIPNQEHSKINLKSGDVQISTGKNGDQCVGLPTALPGLCILNKDVIASEPTSSESVLKPMISNIRILPKIVDDELLPKGSITLSFVNSKSTIPNTIAAKIGNGSPYSENINEMDENEKNRELTIHKRSTYISIANVPQSQTTANCRNQASASDSTSDINVDSNTVDNYLHGFKNPHHLMNDKSPGDMKTDIIDQTSVIVDQHFDSTQLWKICPELENYFSNDDAVNNNNNDEGLLNFYILNTKKTNCDDNSVHALLTEVDTETNIDNSMDPPTNNVIHIPENANNLQDVSESAIAVNAIDHNGMEMVPPECIATEDESNSTKCCVIADLTTANLRHFNNILSRNVKEGLNWSTKSCEYYLSQEDIVKHSNEPGPNVAIDTSWEVIEYASESGKEFSQAESKKRKRKWIQDEKKMSLKPIGEKRLKLNRNKRSIDGKYDLENMSTSTRLTLVESIKSGNCKPLNIVESTRSPKKTSNAELKIVKRRVSRELIVVAERIEISQGKYNCETKKIVNSTATDEKEDIKISTTIPVCTVDSGPSQCEFRNDSRLQGALCITSSQNFQNDNSDSDSDGNGNLTSIGSSSSSSSSQSSKSISNYSKTSNKNNTGNDKPEPYENECQKQEEMEEELDTDCISLFAESTFTNFDQATNVTDVISILPPLEAKKSDEKFQDMSNVGAYFDENIHECNEAYEACKQQEDKNMHNTSHIVPNAFANEDHDRIIPQLQREISNQPNLSQSMQYVGCESYSPAITLHESSLHNIANLRDRFSENRRLTHGCVSMKSFFDWHCFRKLSLGSCNRPVCRFHHYLGPHLRNLKQRDPDVINQVIDFAILNGYNYFIQYMYPRILMKMDYLNTIKLFYKLCNNGLLNDHLVKTTLNAVTNIGISLRHFLSDIACLLNENDYVPVDCILMVIAGKVERGAFWDTCRDLLIKMKPSNLSIDTVISECIYNKDKLQIKDVYINYLKRLTMEQVSSINVNLREQIDHLLVVNNLIHKPQHSSQPLSFENVNCADKTLEMNVTENVNNKEQIEIATILSPDDAVHHNYENSIQLSPKSIHHISQKFSSQESSDTESFVKDQGQGSNSTACNHSFYNQRRSAATQVDSVVEQHSRDLNIKTSEPGDNVSSSSSFSSSFKLYQIDDLPPTQSAFRDRHWRFHLTMNNLKEALSHKEYLLALKILNKYSEKDQTIFTSSCYKMLRKTVMASPYHVKNMIKLSVQMGYNKCLNETLFNFGMYTMIELCNSHAWVLAYSLFKSMRRYSTTLTENIAAFALISAEICLANRHPLKAFTILKQHNMLCTSRSKWCVVSDPNDEHVRVVIINLLLDVLCTEHPDRAFYIFTYLLKDQTRIYHPVDLTAYIDKLVLGVLKGKRNDLITDVGKVIIENNFTLENSVFQSLVINVFQNDVALCRQLYRYGTWVGIYPIIKLTLPLHIFIKTNWMQEEMYLVVIDFLEKLSMDIGPAIDRIGPNQFTIHLVFELAPFKQQLLENNVQICNNDELKMSKELMKTVLRERFNPPLRTIIAEKERFMKLQSCSVVNYLKSMIVQQ